MPARTGNGRDCPPILTARTTRAAESAVSYNLRLKKWLPNKQNLQDAFLNNVRKAKVPVTIFLMNGVKLQGVITWFDNFCVLLRRDGQSQLVYKHAISTVMPSQPITLYEAEDQLTSSASRMRRRWCCIPSGRRRDRARPRRTRWPRP